MFSTSCKFISSNIRFDNPADGNHVWQARRKILANCLLSYSPDVIGTQEGKVDQIYDLNSLLPHFKLVEQHRKWLSNRMYPCIFFNKKTIDLIESGDRWLSETPEIDGSSSFESAFPRLFTWAKLRQINTDFEFLFIVTHLDHIKSFTRQKQIEILLQEFCKINKENLPFILGGDFNESPDGNVRSIIGQSSLMIYDPWMQQGHAEEPSHHHFSKPEKSVGRIDWFLLHKDLKCKEIFFDKTHENEIYPSDHYPLKMEVLFSS